MSRVRVLLVEDHLLVQDCMREILAAEFEIVAVVEHGDEILEAAQRLLPDVIVLDISLPGRSGTQVLPELRAVLPPLVSSCSRPYSIRFTSERRSRAGRMALSRSGGPQRTWRPQFVTR